LISIKAGAPRAGQKATFAENPMARLVLTEDHALRLGAALTGLTLAASAALAAGLAREHMAQLGALCGAAAHPHCGWCYGAAALALAGLPAFAAALRPVSLSEIKAKLRRR
jgi:hypothetical protein